jgi:hypothetical protein
MSQATALTTDLRTALPYSPVSPYDECRLSVLMKVTRASWPAKEAQRKEPINVQTINA